MQKLNSSKMVGAPRKEIPQPIGKSATGIMYWVFLMIFLGNDVQSYQSVNRDKNHFCNRSYYIIKAIRVMKIVLI